MNMKFPTKSLIILFVVLIISAINISAFSLNEGKATSIKDPIYIDMPDNMHQAFSTTVKIHINDKNVLEEANVIDIFAGDVSYPINSKIYVDSSGQFRNTMKYNGEKEIQFGVRPSRAGTTLGVHVNFYKTKVLDSEKYPDTHDLNSEFYGWQCNTERNDLFCGDKEKCMVCYKSVGLVMRDIGVSWSRNSVSVPSGFDFKIVDYNTENDDNLDYYAGNVGYSYYGKSTHRNLRGEEFEANDGYSISIDTETEEEGFDAVKQWKVEWASSHDFTTIKDIGAPGGITSGKAFEILRLPPIGKAKHFDDINLEYELVSQLNPPNSGYLSLKVKRNTEVDKGAGQAVVDKVLSEAKSFVSSFTISKDKVYTPNEELKHVYYVMGEQEVAQEEIKELKVYGTILDGLSNPMPYMPCIVGIDGKYFEGKTNEDGEYEIPIGNIELSDEDIPVKFYVDFFYNRDGKEYFKLKSKNVRGKYRDVSFVTEQYKISNLENLEINLDFSKSIDWRKTGTSARLSDLKHLSVIFFHTHEAVDFMLTKLNADIDYKLPVDIWVGNTDDDTLYSPRNSDILISAADASITSTNRPKNREYHEFSHHLMYATYKKWPDGRLKSDVKNHAGYMNSNTADSYIEGFAEFMALVISEEAGDKNPDIYASFGSFEEDYKPWSANGKYEEIAIASLLWDMYDGNNEKDDQLTMTLDEMWKIIGVDRSDFYEYYKAFKSAYPEKSKEIDLLFSKHGFFQDTRIGDKNHTAGEPWRYDNPEKTSYTYYDLSDNVTKLKYKEGLKIGYAANYERLDRTQAVMVDSYVHVEKNNVDQYKVSVKHEDGDLSYEYITQKADDKIFVSPLPLDVKAIITIEPLSSKYISNNPLVIDETVLSGFFEGEDKFEHDFDLEKTGEDEEYIIEQYGDIGFNYNYKGDLGKEVIYELEEFDRNDIKVGEEKSFPWGLIVFIMLAGLIIATYVKYRLNKKTFDISTNSYDRNQNNGNLKIEGAAAKTIGYLKEMYFKIKPVVVNFSKEYYFKFKEKGIPVIKKVASKTYEYSIIIYDKVIYYVKVGYAKIKMKINNYNQNRDMK